MRDLSQSVDVAVLGGGPAGTAAALTLLKRPGVSVAVVEGSAYDAPRAGESLTPGVRPLLEYLGVWDAFRQQNALEAFGSHAAWGRPDLGSLDYLFTLHGTGWSLDRVAFDRMLADAVAARGGAVLTRTRFAGAARDGDGWAVRLEGETAGTLRARYLIDATGRPARLARRLGAVREVHDRLVGVGGIARLADGAAVESAVVVEATELGWWYSAPVPGRGLAVVLMSDADLVSRHHLRMPEVWTRRLRETDHTRARAEGAALPEPRVVSAHTGRLLQPGGDGWVAVGDAVASHDPLSSTGIPHALGSGVHGALVAADALFAEGAMLPAYAEGVRADVDQYLLTRDRYYQREARWPDAPFWARRRARVALDPRATIVGASGAPGRPVHLTPARAAALLDRCREGRPVHEAVRAFAEAYPDVPHQRAILGLQELVGRGAVDLAA